jgi:phosphatidylinositol alpha-1,6-mannosyltransferase
VEKKGVRYLIKAMPKILASEPKAVLTVVGDGPEKAALGGLVDELGLTSQVSFVGAVSNEKLHDHYTRSDVFVAPSIRDREGDTEALGVVILEAAASGTPIVATVVGGIPDIVTSYETGLLAEAANSDELAEAILCLAGDQELSKRLASNARRLVEAKFAWGSIVDRFDSLIEEVLHRTNVEQTQSNRRYHEAGD